MSLEESARLHVLISINDVGPLMCTDESTWTLVVMLQKINADRTPNSPGIGAVSATAPGRGVSN